MWKAELCFFLLAVLLLPSAPANGITITGERSATVDKGGARNGGEKGPELEWQILTMRNSTSQIREHPHLLVLVTVPWSGESRSLKKDVVHLISTGHEKLRDLKLMVVHMNSEKLLAAALGATEEITLVYYHHARRFKYEGKLRAKSILASVSYLMSFQPEEVPLESLSSEKDLKAFLQSTDEAVLLLEFCGWSAGLLHKKDGGSNESSFPAQNFSGNGDILGENPNIGNEPLLLSRVENRKETEKLTCEVENELNAPWLEGIIWGNKSASSDKLHCTSDEFRVFESFFPKFTKAAREFFLPPEKLRFGLVSERSLLPLLGVEGSDSWMLIHCISGCQNCSKVLQDVDDLRATLQPQHSPVMELDGDQSNHYPAFPMNRPSIILFIDRSSNSTRVREESNSSLDVFRRFAQQNQPSSQMSREHDCDKSGTASLQDFHGGWSKKVSDVHGPLRNKLSSGHRVVKSKDNKAFIIINEGKATSSDGTADDAKESSAFELLAELLRQKSPLSDTKETKLSLIAKEVGFQLLSEDLEVKVVGSLPSHKDSDPPVRKPIDITKGSRSSDTHTGTFVNPVVLHDNLVDRSTLNANGDEKHPETKIITGALQHIEEVVPGDVSTTDLASFKSSQEAPKGRACVHNTEVIKNGKFIHENVDSSYTCHNDNSHYLKEDHTTTDDRNLVDKEHLHYVAEISSDAGLVKNSNVESSDLTLVRGNARPGKDSMGKHELMENQLHHFGFTGSYYFSDGGHRLLKALTGSSKIPTVVVLDPISEQHYVLTETEICYSSLVNFIDKFLNGSLAPYQRSEVILAIPSVAPQPPFVNLDFHEADSIPRVTSKMLSEIILGLRADDHNPVHASKGDVLVLFSNSWCGFCQRMELVVREIYRAFQVLSSMLNSGSVSKDIKSKQDDFNKVMIVVPSIFYIDCTHNDCSSNLKLLGMTELLPMLLLFPAEKKDVLSYEGDMSVNNVIEFLAAHGTNTHYLNRYKGIFWTQWQKGSNRSDAFHGTTYVTSSEKFVADGENHVSSLDDTLIGGENNQLIGSHALDDFPNKEHQVDVVIGCILSATIKLLNVFPFDNSSILMVRVNKDEGFQGLIINKRITWEAFEELDEAFEPLKCAPLFYGGPVRVQNLALVSLAQEAKEGYSEVLPGLYYGNPYVTNLSIKAIMSGNQPATDYWFFLGFSSWGWNQLFSEIAEGAWDLSNSNIEHVNWPEN